ncbi:nitrilase and fragile histidine triad fusion protein NitFhit isoform X2 [Dermacentor andersoni]|uniref:nitrilase and fragile histidine triad fusion protein NitFhit isoform X2 n=1 Tax=Dermacentor andersoni TaxID=34620 RepID=UPI002417E8E4|nr:nitrilase and fragile histidine triad fusion protein NitFhit-like isoform X2 [Dermacentor andersoni]
MALAAISGTARGKVYELLVRSLVGPSAARKMFSTSSSNGNLIAVCQVTSTSDKAANFETCSALIQKARERGAQVVFLPEAVDFIAEKKAQAYELAEPLDGPIVTKYKELARKLGVWLSLGSVHVKAMMRTRAIENQCYVVSAAQVGQHNSKRSSYGHALVVDPWGCVVAQCSDTVGLALAEINHDLIKKVRRAIPVWDHRRTDLYGNLSPCWSANSNEVPDKDQYQFGQVTLEESQIFYKSSLSMAFVNKMPVLPGHVLVAPFRPALRLSDLSSEEVQDLFLVVQKVQRAVEKHFGASSSTVSIQDGPDAGRSINHIHVHVLPRKPGDFSHNDNVYVKLQEHDKDDKKPKRSAEEMAEEARLLRALFQ